MMTVDSCGAVNFTVSCHNHKTIKISNIVGGKLLIETYNITLITCSDGFCGRLPKPQLLLRHKYS